MRLNEGYFIEACKKIKAGYTPGGSKAETYHSGVKLANMLLDDGFITPSDRVLDVGCGNGRLAMGLYSIGLDTYTGMDIIPQCIEFCRDTFKGTGYRFYKLNNRNSHYHDGELAPHDVKYPISSNSIDIVIAFSFFSHTATVRVAQAHLAEIKRVLRSGGVLFSTWFFGYPREDEKLSIYSRIEIDLLLQNSGFSFLEQGSLHGSGNLFQTTLAHRIEK